MNIQTRRTRVLSQILGIFMLLLSLSCVSVESGSGGSNPELQALPFNARPRVMVEHFKLHNRVRSYNYEGANNMAENLPIRLEAELMETARFIIVDRANIKATMKEQDFGAGDRVDERTAPKIGKIQGAQLYIRVEILDMSVDGGAIAFATSSWAAGLGARSYTVELNVKVIDIATTQVVYMKNFKAVATSYGVVGAGAFTHKGRDYWVGGGGFFKTPIGEAMQAAMKDAAYGLGAAVGRQIPTQQ